MPTVTVSLPETKSPPQSPKKKTRRILLPTLLYSALIAFAVLGLILIGVFSDDKETVTQTQEIPAMATQVENEVPSWVDVQLISLGNPSRRGEKLEKVADLVVHYVANPGTSAQANRNYFASEDTDTSSHFIVGLQGEVIQCIPLDEKSSASNHRNRDTVSIEVCHPDETGEFSPETKKSLVELLAWLCEKFGLDKDHIIRHYDVTGKMCPLYYVEHEDDWEELKNSVESSIE